MSKMEVKKANNIPTANKAIKGKTQLVLSLETSKTIEIKTKIKNKIDQK